MVRNALMPQMQLYDAPQAPSVNTFINPLMAGFKRGDELRQQEFQNERAKLLEGRQGEQLQLAKNADERARKDRMTKNFGNMMLAVVNEPDEAKAQAYWQQIKTMPDFAQEAAAAGYDLNDHRGTSRLLAGKAGVLPDPQDRALKQAQIDQTRMGTATSQAQLQQIKMQTPEARAGIAARYNIQPSAPEYNAFVLNGTYTSPSRDDLLTTSEGQTISQKVRGIDGQIIGAKPLVIGQSKPPPEHIAKTANFAGRMIEAERHVRRMIEGVDPIDGTPSAKFGATDWNATIANAPPDFIGNQMRGAEHQQYRQAAQQWIRAFLRKESGAAIGSDEFEQDFRTYFPQPGDRNDVVKQKQAARSATMQGFAMEAGDYFTKQRPDLVKHLNLYGSTSPDSTIRTAPNPLAQPGLPNPPPAQQQQPSGAGQRAINPTTKQVIEWDGQQWAVVK